MADKLPTWDQTTPTDLPTWDETTAIDDPGVLEAAKEGALEAVTFGFAPEITAAARSAFGDTSFEEALKEEKAETKAAERTQPAAFTTGQVAGTVGSLLIPGGAVVKGVGTLAKTAKGVKAISTVKKAGTLAKDITKKQIAKKGGAVKIAKSLAINTAVDAVTSVPGGGAMGRKLLSVIKGYIKKGLTEKAAIKKGKADLGITVK